jgi:N-succinyldiaminopimelate aminotransferase
MPRSPQPNQHAASLQPAVFTRLSPIIAKMADKPVPLHIGDTFLSPPAAARLERVAPILSDSIYAYSAPNGLPSLRGAFCERWTRLGKRDLDLERVHITVGATGAVSAALHAFVLPGEEVLLLSPFWPLVRGMITAMGAVPVEVPFYGELAAGRSVAEVLAPHISERTAALYVCSPNNPSGAVLDEQQCLDLATFCVDNSLWVISDEAYGDYAFAPHQHRFMADLPGMGQRTASIYTASKSYAMAGMRVGFLVGDPLWLESARRVTTHNVYNVPEACQRMVEVAIKEGDDWVANARQTYSDAADLVAARLQASFPRSKGGGFVFVDLADALGERDLLEYLVELLHEGVSLCPGGAFGQHWQSHVRLCYMSVPSERLELAIDRLNRSLDRLRGAPSAL